MSTDLRLKNLRTNVQSSDRRLTVSQPVYISIPLPPPNLPDLLKRHSHINLKPTQHFNNLSFKVTALQPKKLQQRRTVANTQIYNTRMSDRQSSSLQPRTELKLSSGLCSNRLARVRDLTRLTGMSPTLPGISSQTSTTNTYLSNSKISSILKKDYKCPQTSTFTWVRHVIPMPPPNLEEVERKLYPHRFKIIVGDISTFVRIPSPPPHMPESMLFPMLDRIPSPPPNIPDHLLGPVEVSSVRVRTNIVPNPIRCLIPHPPPDIPPEMLGPQLAIVTGHTSNPILSIPPPPPDIPISPSFDSSDSFDSFYSITLLPPTLPLPPVNTPEFHSMHLCEIVSSAKLRQEERRAKADAAARSKPENFRERHLQEIIAAAGIMEKEKKGRILKEVSSNPDRFRELHLQEIVNAANLREEERVANIREGNAIVNLLQERCQQTQLISINLPYLKKEVFYSRLISELGLSGKGNEFANNIPTYSDMTIDNKFNLLNEIENALSVGYPPINSLLPPSLMHVLHTPNYPDLSKHHSHMSRHLTPEIYQQLSKRVTKSGFTLDQAIQTGIDNAGDAVSLTIGCVAGDEDSYSKFAELFDLVIETVHYGYSIDKVHYSDFDPIHFSDGYFDQNYVLSCRVRAGRSIKGFPFLPQCTRAERRKVESIVKLCLNNMPHPFKGSYHAISSLSAEDHGYLTSRCLLFQKPTSPMVISSRMTRDWPDARGLWVNRDENFFAWVNEKDHVRLISMEEGGDLGGVFERFCLGVQLFEMVLNLRGYEAIKNKHLGYILTCPSNLGTGMKVSLRVRLPIVSRLPEFTTITGYLRLEKRDTSEFGIFDISNKHSLGYTEVGIVQEVINSVQLLIKIEKALWSGYSLLETLRENKPGLADVIIAGVHPRDPFRRVKCVRNLIPNPPPNMPVTF